VHFLIDAQLPVGLVRLFRQAGHEATHVEDVGLLAARDSEIRPFAARAGMVIVTKDEDFVIKRQLSARAPSVVWIRTGNTTNRALTARMKPVMEEILMALAEGEPIVEVR
jgi:predicted nuclease of predicted toxin-antitoxin system